MSQPISALKPLLACLLLCGPAASFAAECGDPSPTTISGISLHEEHSKTELTQDEVRAANNLLRRFEGNWQGQGIGIICLGQGASTRERVRYYEIEADGTGKRTRGEMDLDLDHENGSVSERLRLVLNGSRLGTSNSSSSVVEVLSISQDQVEWLYRYKGNEGRTPIEARWQLSFSSTPGRQGQQATVEHRVYSLGGLASQGSWSIDNR